MTRTGPALRVARDGAGVDLDAAARAAADFLSALGVAIDSEDLTPDGRALTRKYRHGRIRSRCHYHPDRDGTCTAPHSKKPSPQGFELLIINGSVRVRTGVRSSGGAGWG